MSFVRSAGSAFLVAWIAGCAAPGVTARPVAAPSPKSDAAGADGVPALAARSAAVTVVPAIVISPFSEQDVIAKFEAGRTDLLAGAYARALATFEQLLRLAPDGPTAAPSLFNYGIALEGLGDRAGALERYREFLRRYPGSPFERGAMLRSARALGYLERWAEIGPLVEALLGRDDLALLERIEGLGIQGLALAELDDLDSASRVVDAAETAIEDHRLGEAGKPPFELATVRFARGEIRRKKSERIVFDPLPASFADALEERCTALLDSQHAYSDAMRSFDAHWSAMAGYRIGQLYQQLHRDVMRAPVPSAADTVRKKQLFEAAMRLRYRILLEKGLTMMGATVRLGERTGEDSPWIARAGEATRDMQRALDDENSAIAKMPFSEAEIRAALDQLTPQSAHAAPKR